MQRSASSSRAPLLPPRLSSRPRCPEPPWAAEESSEPRALCERRTVEEPHFRLRSLRLRIQNLVIDQILTGFASATGVKPLKDTVCPTEGVSCCMDLCPD
ncbi:hypothetical protein NDU88_004402 [Pleurodeles waltl]|uniref:Uncharacterized protein n=1 Tax=Pleurodeles waltl TaxID=8319 RepID=A0AAV7VIS6_PLEWA|nr:hypothetical protein NDU88_004402 [Pleurodeles waltl]